MLLIKTYVDKSRIHGLGLFADEEIETGTVIWKEGFEILYKPQEFEKLSGFEKQFISIWGWRDKHDGLYHLPLDNDRFINHSDEPNTKVEPSGLTVATSHIKRGEEILCNYAEFEADFRFNNH